MRNQDNRNRLCFGMGTIGRDMFYSFEANTILYFLSDVLGLQRWEFAAASLILSFLRIFDAVNDPITGLLIDNIRSPWVNLSRPFWWAGCSVPSFSLCCSPGSAPGGPLW